MKYGIDGLERFSCIYFDFIVQIDAGKTKSRPFYRRHFLSLIIQMVHGFLGLFSWRGKH